MSDEVVSEHPDVPLKSEPERVAGLAVKSVTVVKDPHNKSPGRNKPLSIVEFEFAFPKVAGVSYARFRDVLRIECESEQVEQVIVCVKAALGLKVG